MLNNLLHLGTSQTRKNEACRHPNVSAWNPSRPIIPEPFSLGSRKISGYQLPLVWRHRSAVHLKLTTWVNCEYYTPGVEFGNRTVVLFPHGFQRLQYVSGV